MGMKTQNYRDLFGQAKKEGIDRFQSDDYTAPKSFHKGGLSIGGGVKFQEVLAG
jgi:hypothetical protein